MKRQFLTSQFLTPDDHQKARQFLTLTGIYLGTTTLPGFRKITRLYRVSAVHPAKFTRQWRVKRWNPSKNKKISKTREMSFKFIFLNFLGFFSSKTSFVQKQTPALKETQRISSGAPELWVSFFGRNIKIYCFYLHKIEFLLQLANFTFFFLWRLTR